MANQKINRTVPETVGGLEPYDGDLTYNMTVKYIQDRLQEKVDGVVASHNAECDNNPEYAKQYSKFPQITVKADGVKVGKWFTFIMISLPAASITDRQKKKHVKNEVGALTAEGNSDGGGRVGLNPMIWNIFKPYTFTNNELAIISTPRWQKEEEVHDKVALNTLKTFAHTRIVNKNNEEIIVFNIDVKKIAHALLKFKAPAVNLPYDIQMTEITKIQDTNYSFRIRREICKGKKNKSDSDQTAFLQSFMKGKK